MIIPFTAGMAGAAAACDDHGKTPKMAFEKSTMRVMTANGEVPFSIEVARSNEQLAQGLMHRTSLPEDYAMLFVFPQNAMHAMWMKDTPSPLDMLFIDSTGRIVHVHHMAEPYSLDPISPGEPVKAVAEMAGGLAVKYGIKAGDRVIHEMFRP